MENHSRDLLAKEIQRVEFLRLCYLAIARAGKLYLNLTSID